MRTLFRRPLPAALLASLLGAALAHAATSVDLTPERLGSWGFDSLGEDPGVRPGDDFFHFANGHWLERTVIPTDKASYGSFAALAELSERRVRAILEESATAAPAAPGTDAEKIGAFYRSFMDTAGIEARGSTPLAAELAAIKAAKTPADLARLMGASTEDYYGSVFAVALIPDARDPTHYAVTLAQAGLGLPDRDYYLEAQFAAKKRLYEEYVAGQLAAVQWPEARERAAKIVEFETRIARASWSRTEQRDPVKTYNPLTLAQLESLTPGFEWPAFLDAAGLANVRHFVIAEKTAFPQLAAILHTTPIATLRAWQAFNLVDNAAPYLPDSFVQRRFEFRDRTLSGQPELAPRWKRAVAAVEAGSGVGFNPGGMGEAVGRIYVARYFTPEAKAQMQQLVANLKAAFRARLERLEWMGPATKARALEKLAGYRVKIGYPDRWRDYSTLVIRPDDILGNVRRAQTYEWRRSLARLDQAVDREDWQLNPQDVNAYNNPLFNEIVFPAAILQPPFFDPAADPAVNYGGIGGAIGHEMTHGFDDQGRRFDAQGRLRDWWESADAERFQAAARRLAAQYSAFELLPGAHVNGELTLGEDIADLGGLSIALDAYRTSLKGEAAPVIDGLSGEQRLFLGWAQVWRRKVREDELRRLLVIDVHAPAEARVNLPMRNIDAWYEAFKVEASDRGYLPAAERVHIW